MNKILITVKDGKSGWTEITCKHDVIIHPEKVSAVKALEMSTDAILFVGDPVKYGDYSTKIRSRTFVYDDNCVVYTCDDIYTDDNKLLFPFCHE